MPARLCGLTDIGIRVVSVGLLAAVLSIIPFSFYIESIDLPSSSLVLWALLACALVAPISLLLLVLLTRRLVRHARPPDPLRRRLHAATFIFGPFGCVWVIFRLTATGQP